jgi:hypothetical protein
LTVQAGSVLLRGRYRLVGEGIASSGGATSWKARSEDGVLYLLKTWSYEGDEPDRVRQALWDAELRTLYKVGSTPGADDALVVLKDAGLDRDAHCFVMVLEAPGYESLAPALTNRAAHAWLHQRDASGRGDLWSALGRVASGLSLLHEQKVLHRDVSVEALLFSPEEGTTSLRLGGFEWSVRLGRPLDADPPVGWPAPPERGDTGATAWRPDDDWFGFGMLAARLMLDIENYGTNEPRLRHQRVLKAVAAATRLLTEQERTLIGRLIAADPLERITRPYDVRESVASIVGTLAAPAVRREDDRPYTLVINHRSQRLTDYLVENGLNEYLKLPTGSLYNPLDPAHAAGACDFMRQELDGAELCAVPRREIYVLVGRRIIVLVAKGTDRDERKSWQTAFCAGPGELRTADLDTTNVRLPGGRLASVFHEGARIGGLSV